MAEKLPDKKGFEEPVRAVSPRIGLKREPVRSPRGELMRHTVFLAIEGKQDPMMIAAEIDRDVFSVMSGRHDEIRSINVANVFERTGLYMNWVALRVSAALEGLEEKGGKGLSSMEERTVLTSEEPERPRGEYFSLSEEIVDGIQAAIAMRGIIRRKN